MDSLKLINAEQPLDFNGETFQVKKASLAKVILFQTEFNKLSDAKDPAIETKMAAYCLYLILKDVKLDVTPEWVLDNVAGDINFADVVEQFGFMNRQKVAALRKVLGNAPIQEETSGGSSSQ